MDASALLEALIETSAKIDNLWSMFIGVQLAIFWMILMIPRPLLFFERLVAFGALAIFNFINGGALKGSYEFLEIIATELSETTVEQVSTHPLLLKYLQEMDFTDRPMMLVMTHAGSLLVVGLIITFQSQIYRSYIKMVAKHAPDSVNKLSAP